ncbi:hypothetical protein CDCA_CDCA09G2845 [Cyanidium caldarium]|uniref:GCK domain-containing protein n=1 Tax=Cyanidium caldarium TaxID=2771 RepID=A0AAV9IXK9_CYACA|nr:hypothetical protein CDCA_CDCA09G2845 [Cyanidium caldarium]|eukprot:ctg_2954.g397
MITPGVSAAPSGSPKVGSVSDARETKAGDGLQTAPEVVGAGSAASETPQDPPDTRTKEQLIEDALNCPCIDNMKKGSCGGAFVAAYRCFLESETDPKGADCIDFFQQMQDCMVAHADEYHLDELEEVPERSTGVQPPSLDAETGFEDTRRSRAIAAASSNESEKERRKEGEVADA